MPWKETTTMEQKIEFTCLSADRFVNGVQGNTRSQSYAEALKFPDQLLTKSLPDLSKKVTKG